jgi:hypothetical protein
MIAADLVDDVPLELADPLRVLLRRAPPPRVPRLSCSSLRRSWRRWSLLRLAVALSSTARVSS